jgi:hypothetical protein
MGIGARNPSSSRHLEMEVQQPAKSYTKGPETGK